MLQEADHFKWTFKSTRTTIVKLSFLGSLTLELTNAFAVVITGGLYWSMIESGQGLVATCLPTIYGLLKARGAWCAKRRLGSKHGNREREGNLLKTIQGSHEPASSARESAVMPRTRAS